MNGEAARASAIAQWRAPALLAAVAILAVGVLAGFFRAVIVAPLHVPFDPNEGWNAYHAAAAVIRENPYPPPGSFMTNNYPPLSFYVVGVLGSWIGDNVVAGRLVSLAAFLLLCVFVAMALRRLNASPISAAFAALLLASMLLFSSDYVGMNDPQLFGHALQLGALLLLLRARRNNSALVVSAALFAAGGFVKHNLFALPLASLAWLAVFDRRSAFKFAAVLIGLSLAGICVVWLILGVNLLHELQSARIYSFDLMKRNTGGWLPVAALPLCSLVWLAARNGKDRVALLPILYAGISIASGLVLFAGAGVDVNALFDADIALSLCVGLAVSQSAGADRRMWRAVGQVFAVLCIAPLAVIALRTPDWREPSFWLHPLQEETALAAGDVDFLRAHRGPAICEDLTFCYWAGKEATVDVFNLDQQFATGARNSAGFLRLLNAHKFAVVELDETVPFPFVKDVEHVFLRNYRLDHQDDEGAFFVPR